MKSIADSESVKASANSMKVTTRQESAAARRKITGLMTILLMAICVVLAVAGCSEKKPKIYRVGIISGADFFLPVLDGFKSKMTKLGYVEGHNIYYEHHRLNDDPDAERKAAQKLVNDKVDLIFTVPTEPTVVTKSVVLETGIPMVFAYAGLEGNELARCVQEPDNNITGVRFPGPDQIAKRLEILLKIIPSLKRVWVGYDENYPNSLPALEGLRRIAPSQGLTLVEAPVGDIKELRGELDAREESPDIGLDAIILMPDGLNHCPAGWGTIKTFAAKHNVPVGGSFLYTVEDGALFGNANDLFKVGELAAPMADKIFKGFPAGKIPVATPEQDVWINYAVAQKLGLTIPEGLMSIAAKIIR